MGAEPMAAFWKSDKALSDDPQIILEACCSVQQPAKVVFDDEVMQATFVSLSKDNACFELLKRPVVNLTPLSMCYVAFSNLHCTGAFTSKVCSYQFPELSLSMPRQVSVAKARTASRVPIDVDSELSVRVKTMDSIVWLAQAIDISLAGIQIAFDEEPKPDLAVGAQLDVELRYHDNALRLDGVIRRKAEGGRYGLFFPSCVVRGDVQPPVALRQIVNDMEQAWLRSHLHQPSTRGD